MNAPSLLPAFAPRRTGVASPVKPQLTSLVDMMTILLVFLLKSFSMEGDLMSPASGLRLPTSSSRDRAVPEVSVEVTRAEIRVDGRPVVALADLDLARAATEASVAEPIPELAAALAARTLRDAGAPGDAEGDHPTHAVTIQCDRDGEFRLLERVMTTCSAAGFTDFSLLVMREDS
jgi:biopolymer transport protein ExbD